jgi:hypothetical protein
MNDVRLFATRISTSRYRIDFTLSGMYWNNFAFMDLISISDFAGGTVTTFRSRVFEDSSKQLGESVIR